MAIESVGTGRPQLLPIVGLLLLETSLVVCWSSGFVGIRYAIDHGPVFLILLWRTLASGVLLLPFALLIGPKPRLAEIAKHLVFGALAMSGYLAGFAIAIARGVPTGLVALIADMLPLAIAMLSLPVLGHLLNGRQWVGLGIGFLGVLVASVGSLHVGEAPPWAYSMPVLGMLSLALATLLQKRFASSDMPVHQSLCIQCFAAAVIFSAFAAGEGGIAPVYEWEFIIGIGWLVIVATFGGYGLYYLCLRRSSPARVSSVLYLSPPVTMLWAWLMFDEPLSGAMAVGLVVSLSGIVLASR
ncbi:DMT family transporter [Mesorhizobium sp. 1B3]|uniref:DMT family transporter n=1 Tax=Mesorhizobium sp. 1B3 TaxID=3243599 RepID=UPI003D9531B1